MKNNASKIQNVLLGGIKKKKKQGKEIKVDHMIFKKITTSWRETNVIMTKSHKLLPQIMVFPGKN